MKYIKRVATNMRCGVNVALGPLTLVVGPNEAGKSTTLNAIELCALGGCSNIGVAAWRAAGVELYQAVAPTLDEPISALVELDDGGTVQLMLEPNLAGGCFAPVRTGIGNVPITMPMTPFVKGVTGSAESVRTFLLREIASVVSLQDVYDRFDVTLHPLLDRARVDTGTPLDQLIEVTKLAKSRGMAATRESNTIKNAANGVASGLAPRPLEAMVEAARVARDAAHESLALHAKTTPPPDISVLAAAEMRAAARVQGCVDAATAITREYEALRAEAKHTDHTVGPNNKIISALSTLLDASAQAVTCVLCGGEIPPGAVAARQAAVADTVDCTRAVERAIELRAAYAQVSATYDAACDVWATAKAALAAAQNVVDDTAAVNAARAAHEAYADAERVHAALVKLVTQHDTLTPMRTQVTALTEDATRWHALHAAGADAIKALLDSSREGYIARVNALLDGDTFDLVLSEGPEGKQRDVCMYGLRRNGRLHTVSGSAQARLLAAMAGATLKPLDGVTVLTPHMDVDIEPATLRHLMVALTPLADRGVQVVLFATKLPSGRTPKGWTISHLTIGEGG